MADTIRLQVSVSNELVERIDNYAKMIGVGRSALCAIWIADGLAEYDKTYSADKATLAKETHKKRNDYER